VLEQEIDDGERQGESLGRALRGAAGVPVDGLEGEVCEEAEVQAGVSTVAGVAGRKPSAGGGPSGDCASS